MPKFSAYMRGEGAQGEKGDKGEATLITQVNAIAHTSTSTGVFVNYSTDGSDGQTENKVLNFDFHLMQGEAAGFSTKQNATVEMISVGNNPSVTITTSDNSPNNFKVFNFDFKIPKGKEIQNIEQTTSSTTSSGDNIITITYSDNTTTNFTVKNGEQGRASLIDGQVSNTSQLPTGNNYQGRAYLVGETNPKQLWVYLNGQWTNQGVISGAGFGQPTSSIELLNNNEEAFVNVSTDISSPETAKVFNFHFGIPSVSASASTSTLSASSDASVNVSTSNNNIHFNFGIPQGIDGKDGVGIQSITKTGTQGLIDTYTITFTDSTTTEYNITNGKIGKDGEDGTPAGFGNITVNTTTLPSTSSAEVEIIPDDSSPDSNKNFTFNFKIPRGSTGPQGPEGIGFYQKLEFTSTNVEQSIDYNWTSVSKPLDEYDTYILTINRTQNQILPISIYNIQNKNIAATFTLTSPTEQYPYGTIEYETEEKFDGILYYIGEAPTPQLEIGTVTIAEGITPSITNEKVGNNNVLSFSLPSIKGDKGDTGNTGATGPQGPKGDQGIGITNITGPVQDPNDSTKQIYTIVYGENNTTTTFTVSKGDKGDTGAKGDKGDKGDTGASGPGITNITGPVQDPTDSNKQIYTITYGANNETKTFTITNGAKGDPGVSGASEFSQLFGSPYDNESLSTILNNKLDKDGVIIPTLDYSKSITSISTNSYAGTSTYVSRGDHVHRISLTTGDENGQVKIAGVNIDVKGLQSAAYSATTAFYSSSGGNIPTMTVGGGERIDRISITNEDPGEGSDLASNTILFVYTGGGGYSYCPDNVCYDGTISEENCYNSPCYGSCYDEGCSNNNCYTACYDSNCYGECYTEGTEETIRTKYNDTYIVDSNGNLVRYANENELLNVIGTTTMTRQAFVWDDAQYASIPGLYYQVGENEYIYVGATDTTYTCPSNYIANCSNNTNCYDDPCYGECYTDQPCQVNSCYNTTCPTDGCYINYPCPGKGCDQAGCSKYVDCYTGNWHYTDDSCQSETFYCHSFREMNSSTCSDYDGNSCGGFE